MRQLILFILVFCLVACSSRSRLELEQRQNSVSSISQNYSNVSQDLYCGSEPIIRYVDFTFDKKDSLRIFIDITTSLSEGMIKGDLSIFSDDYELMYANTPSSKKYVETLEVESQRRYPVHARGRLSLANIIISSAASKVTGKISEKQYWNNITITIEPEDELQLHTSKDIFFAIETKKCSIRIYPSYQQVAELKKFLNLD